MYLAGFVSSKAFEVAVFDSDGKKLLEESQKFNDNFDLGETLKDKLEQYRGECERKSSEQKVDYNHETYKIKHTVIAAGGPVDEGILEIAHLGKNMTLKREEIAQILRDKEHSPEVHLLNDFESLAYGLLFFDKYGFPKSDFKDISGNLKDLVQDFTKNEKDKIISEEKDSIGEQGNKIITKKYLWETCKKSLVIGPGAGLGIAAVAYGVERKGMPYVESSEGGHYTFSPESEDSVKLVQHTQKVQSNEDFLSHRGIKEIYNYFLYQAEHAPNYKYTYEEIIELAFRGNNNEAVDTVRFICESLGALCGNMANVFKCNDSIFLWSDTLKYIQDLQIEFLRNHFQKRFSARPKHGEKIGKIPVFLIMNEKFPLYGCAYYSDCYVNNNPPNNNPPNPSEPPETGEGTTELSSQGLQQSQTPENPDNEDNS